MTASLPPLSAPADCLPKSSPVKFSLITSPSALVAVLSANIQADVSRNDAKPPAPFGDMTVFHALEPPAISVADYVARVAKYAFCSDACLVAAYHYMSTVVAKEPKLALSSLSVHRLLITSVVLACKYFDDVSYNLMYYSKVGGLPYRELANLEVNMLRILDFRLNISDEKFMAIENEMVHRVTHPTHDPVDDILPPLFTKARAALARVVPVELPSPSDDVDFPSLIAANERIRKQIVRKPRVSRAGSVCTPEGSQLSRNSSMTSVASHVDLPSQENSPVRKGTVVHHGKGKKVVPSPTTPVAVPFDTREVAVTAVSW